MRNLARIIVWVAMLACVVIAARDFVVFMNGGRPWSPLTDEIFSILFYPERNSLVARIPIETNSAEFPVSHKWRGKYQISLWVPDEIRDCTPVLKLIGVQCAIYNEKGVLTYSSERMPSKNVFWFKDRTGSRKGSSRWLTSYCAPSNAPLDELCRIRISLTGDVKAFFEQYHTVHILIEKERDK